MSKTMSSERAKIGVLALQGDYEEHRRMLGGIGVSARLVKRAEDLPGLAGLILPGGESTTMLKFILEESLVEPLKRFYQKGGVLYGTCAGAILLARKVSSPEQPSLELLDVSIERNGYGRQTESHVSSEPCPALGCEPMEMVFIRAPVIRAVGKGVEVLAHHQGTPVFVQQGRILATTFHPELASDSRIHQYFVSRVVGAEGRGLLPVPALSRSPSQ
ncbi:MAG: pyridoxal 5'-phosphate synthase glutaminase subunit PdxT [Acidobacteriota bacterium]